jgi:hypothetical protein
MALGAGDFIANGDVIAGIEFGYLGDGATINQGLVFGIGIGGNGPGAGVVMGG